MEWAFRRDICIDVLVCSVYNHVRKAGPVDHCDDPIGAVVIDAITFNVINVLVCTNMYIGTVLLHERDMNSTQGDSL